MKLNYETCLVGEKVVLVPYRPEHVERYHEWMKSPFLLEMTSSEPLSFEEEVEMQLTWMKDDEKCTFIILSKSTCYNEIEDNVDGILTFEFISSTLNSMVGDVNLFLSEEMSDVEDDEACKKSKRKQAELDLMVAEPNQRGKGLGKEAACLMLLYGCEILKISRFFVKIKEENTASRNLFEHSLQFKVCNYVACFGEYELELAFDNPQDAYSGIRRIYDYQVKTYKVQV